MPRFDWSQSNAVFVPDIDEEHQDIYRTGEELCQALEAGAPLIQVQEILHRLAATTEDHFAHEERLMQAGNYNSFAWHKGQHDTARKRMKEFVSRVENGDAAAGMELTQFLAAWLKDHTSLTDRMMGAFLRNQQRAQL